MLARGARKVGAHPFAPPAAINSTPYGGRPTCVYCGWCASGCGIGTKATAHGVYLARAEELGAQVIGEAFVHRIEYDAAAGRATGAIYMDASRNEHRIEARLVILAAHAFETPRLLLLSANSTYPQGLANSSGLVGRSLMSHPTWQVFGTFDEPINGYKGMQMGHVMVQDHYAPDARNGYARGFTLLSYMMTPIAYANLSGSFYGAEYKRFLHDYAYTAAWWAHAEGLPNEHNTVTLDPERKDARGLPVGRVTYEWGENDVKLAAAARDKAREMMEASGARAVRTGLNYGAHAMGTCRMGHDRRTSVVNEFCRSHDVPNLYICDTSVFVTGAGVNPTLKPCRRPHRSERMTQKQLAALAALANGIIPADDIDAGAGACSMACAADLETAQSIAREIYSLDMEELSAGQVYEFLGVLRDRMPAFFLQLRMDVSARYLNDPEVSRRIGFPGPSIDTGGYPDFDQVQ